MTRFLQIHYKHTYFETNFYRKAFPSKNEFLRILHEANCLSVHCIDINVVRTEQAISIGLFQMGPWWSILKVSKASRNPLQYIHCPISMREQGAVFHANKSWKKVFWKNKIILKKTNTYSSIGKSRERKRYEWSATQQKVSTTPHGFRIVFL